MKTPPPQKQATEATTGPVSTRNKWALPLLLLLALAGAAGVAERLWLTGLGPRHSYPWDHPDNVQMGRAASEHGLFRAYGVPVSQVPSVPTRYWVEANQTFVVITRGAVRPVNYPPLGLTLFWAQSSLLDAVAPGQPVNTFTSRLVMSLASLLGEIIAAVGAFLLVRRLVGTNAGILAAAIVWVLPPLAMDGFLWGQTDAWFIAPALFTILALLKGRWATAGILAAVTTLLKPHGLFLGPIVLFAAAILPVAPGEVALSIVAKRIARLAGAGLATVFLVTLPWTIADGTAWLQRAYLDNFTTQAYEETTLKAFNVWYLDALLHDSDLAPVLDPRGTILGVAKDSWGKLLVLAALVALAVLYFRKFPRKNAPLAVVLFSAVWLWSTFLWPTRVHERYLMYAIPLMVICSFPLKRLWPAALAIILVGSAELCHWSWLSPAAGHLVHPRRVREVYAGMQALAHQRGVRMPTPGDALQYAQEEARAGSPAYQAARAKTEGLEWFLTLACLLGYGWAFAAPFLKLGGADAPPISPPPPGKRVPGAKRK